MQKYFEPITFFSRFCYKNDKKWYRGKLQITFAVWIVQEVLF